jgi:hypothetical protein
VHSNLTDTRLGSRVLLKKSCMMHVVPACVGSGEGSDHFRSYVRSLYLHFCKRLFLGLELMASWSQVNNVIAAPGLPFCPIYLYLRKRILGKA